MTCPNIAEHTPSPTGYLQKHAWAQEMLKTHRQKRCPGCGLFAVWVPKTPRSKRVQRHEGEPTA